MDNWYCTARAAPTSLWSSRRGHGTETDIDGLPEVPIPGPGGSFGRFFARYGFAGSTATTFALQGQN